MTATEKPNRHYPHDPSLTKEAIARRTRALREHDFGADAETAAAVHELADWIERHNWEDWRVRLYLTLGERLVVLSQRAAELSGQARVDGRASKLEVLKRELERKAIQ